MNEGWAISPSFQSENPYTGWVAGFATTMDIISNTANRADGAVDVDLTVANRTAEGQLETRRFRGRWFLIYHPERKQWLLDNAQIIQVP